MKNQPWFKYALALFVGLTAFWLFTQVASSIPYYIKVFGDIMLPVTLGLIIGYLFLTPVRLLQRLFARIIPRASWAVTNGLAVFALYFVLIGVLVLGMVLWIPAILSNLMELVNKLTDYVGKVQGWYDGMVSSSKLFEDQAIKEFLDVQLQSFITQATVSATELAGKLPGMLLTGTTSAVVTLGKWVLGIVASVYMLIERKQLSTAVKRMARQSLGAQRTAKFLGYLNEVDQIFGRFIAARVMESFIVFLIAWVGFLALGLPYAALLAAITGIFNFIPYFGAFIAYAFTLLFTLLAAPGMVIWMTIFVILLQLADAWVISPMLYGERLKLSGFMVIVAITVFGGLFGLLGMTIGVPCFALLLVAVQRVLTTIAGKRKEKKAITEAEG
ncbi:MAG: AI-2E family transporter [Clostridia bacterium]|nr:AI-2E family transporter [Clostridia bacterium]